QVRTLVERVRPLPAGDHPAYMGGVEEQVSADLIGDLADLRHGVFEQVERTAHGDQTRSGLAGEGGQRIEVAAVGSAVDGSLDGGQTVETGRPGGVVSDVPADRLRRSDDGLTGTARGHEREEVGHRPRR